MGKGQPQHHMGPHSCKLAHPRPLSLLYCCPQHLCLIKDRNPGEVGKGWREGEEERIEPPMKFPPA